MNKEQINEVLHNMILYRMKIKSKIEEYRAVQEFTGENFRIEIDELLDTLNRLSFFEEELKNLKKKL